LLFDSSIIQRRASGTDTLLSRQVHEQTGIRYITPVPEDEIECRLHGVTCATRGND
jgi:hypothetical protein